MTKNLWAVEIDLRVEFGRNKPTWVIKSNEDSDGYQNLCVYVTRKEAKEDAKGTDHRSRIVQFVKRESIVIKKTHPHFIGEVSGRR